MRRINLNNFFASKNSLLISLWNFHATINIKTNSNGIYCEERIQNSNLDELVFIFDTLEDAIMFTEKIKECFTKEDIIKVYEKFIEDGLVKKLKVEKNEETKESYIELSTAEVNNIIVNYFGNGKNYLVSTEYDLGIVGHEPKIHYYLIEHLNYDGKKRDNRVPLTEYDLKNAFNDYLNSSNYELVDFKYIGGIHHTGYYIDNDMPYYEGIKLNVKEREKPYQLINHK